MAVEFFVHKMSEHMETAEILEWRVKEGEQVEQYQVIMEVMTDKVTAELEAPAAGIVKGIRPGAVAGATVQVGEPLAYIAAPGETVPALPPLPGYEPADTVQPVPSSAAVRPLLDQPAPLEAGEVRATPIARRVAKELGIDLSLVRGSGTAGRIHEEDVRAYAEAQAAAPALVPAPISAPTGARRPAFAPGTQAGVDDIWEELTPVQRITGERMLASVQTAPQFALSITVDMTNALWLREAVTDRIAAETGGKPSITALLVAAVARALQDNPRANASFVEGRVLLHKKVNVGVAMGGESGLVVPVIRDADGKSLAQITQEMAEYQKKLASLRYAASDVDGGTFTISNLGMYGIDHFTAIINPPQSAILAVGRVVKTPVGLENDVIALRPLMSMTLTVDHRVMDGLTGARMLSALKELLEKPYFML